MSEQYWDERFSVMAKPKEIVFIWEWDVVGDGLLVVRIPKNVSWFRRLRTKIMLGSSWKRLKKLS